MTRPRDYGEAMAHAAADGYDSLQAAQTAKRLAREVAAEIEAEDNEETDEEK